MAKGITGIDAVLLIAFRTHCVQRGLTMVSEINRLLSAELLAAGKITLTQDGRAISLDDLSKPIEIKFDKRSKSRRRAVADKHGRPLGGSVDTDIKPVIEVEILEDDYDPIEASATVEQNKNLDECPF